MLHQNQQQKKSSTTPAGSGAMDANSFPRTPSESNLPGKNPGDKNQDRQNSKPWERSQSALDLKKQDKHMNKMASVMDYSDASGAGSVSEHSTVYWDLSKAEEEMANSQHASNASGAATSGGGKFKISLQTIHQKQEMTSGATNAVTTSPKNAPKYSVTARMVRRMSSESSNGASNTVTEVSEYSLPATPPCGSDNSPPVLHTTVTTTPPISTTTFKFTSLNKSKPNLSVTLSQAVPILQENIKQLMAPSINDQNQGLTVMLQMIKEAWATPQIGRDLAYGLCDVLRDDGGLEILIRNCDQSTTKDIQLNSARVLEQSLTVKNRDEVATKGLEVVVRFADRAKDDIEMTKVATGILENLFKHSENTCSNLIKFGGLDSLLYSIRNSDTITLRHCAVALANLAIYGGDENQSEMISHKAAEWLFPLAFSSDDSIRYYAFLAIAALSANKELEQSVVQSGTLDLVEPFIRNHDPVEFAHSDKAHIQGQSKEWLRRLVPLLSSKRTEAQSLAAFHFAMEAGIKLGQGHKEVIFSEIGAISPLKRLASSTNKLASKFAAQALKIIGEEVPYTLSPQVPLWTVEDVRNWLTQCGFGEYAKHFAELQVDGDLLLQLEDALLKQDLHMTNGITRKRFLRELNTLKKSADYQSCDPTKLDEWLHVMGPEFRQYAYQMLRNGADKRVIRWLNDGQLLNDCGITNGIHRMKILEAAKRFPCTLNPLYLGDGLDGLDKPLDCFISYRRANGSQLASLLKVHLQIRGFTVFLDIEKLKAGKFDDNLLNNVRNARNFILVLSHGCLDRCINDDNNKDWVHREIVAALEGGCNIIPVTDHNFEWPKPESLPEDMRAICYFNGIRWIHDYQDACVEKLEKFINGELTGTPKPGRYHFTKQSFESCEMHGAMFQLGGSSDCASPPPSPSSHVSKSRGGSSSQPELCPAMGDKRGLEAGSKRGYGGKNSCPLEKS